MRTLILTGLALAALSACQPKTSDRDALVESCTSKGERAETCGCIADAMKRNLSADLFSRSAHAIAREKRDIVGYISDLPEADQREFAAAVNDMFSCRLAPPEETQEPAQ